MSEFIVLYHDPIRLSSEESERFIAAQSVWVCRDDRYAFEVHVYAPRGEQLSDFTPANCGEARYRLALAMAGAKAARLAAATDPERRASLAVDCTSEEAIEFALDPRAGRTVNFGEVIDRFTVEAATDDGPRTLATVAS